MEKNEILKCVDKEGNIIGTVERQQGIDKNFLLEAVQLWIINPKTKQVLMQRRNAKKENDANMIDVSSSGHVKANETKTQAILRETVEEVGVQPEELITSLKDIMTLQTDFTKLGRKGRYVIHEYMAFLDHPLSFYKKQDDEVAELFFMDYETVKEKIRNKEKDMRIPYDEVTEELFSKIDEHIYNLNKGEKRDFKCEEK